MPSAGGGFIVGILSADAELNLTSVNSLCNARVRGAWEVRQGAAGRNTITLGLSLFVIRSQMVEFKGTQRLMLPQAAFKISMGICIGLNPKPRSQPLVLC